MPQILAACHSGMMMCPHRTTESHQPDDQTSVQRSQLSHSVLISQMSYASAAFLTHIQNVIKMLHVAVYTTISLAVSEEIRD